MATILLNKKLFENKNEFPKSHGVNYYECQFNNTELDYSLANIVFQYWQSMKFDTNISNEQQKIKIGKFIIHFMVFIIMSSYIKYRNRLTIYIRVLLKFLVDPTV